MRLEFIIIMIILCMKIKNLICQLTLNCVVLFSYRQGVAIVSVKECKHNIAHLVRKNL